MKKIIAVILALFYLGISTGATIHMHYCMGKLAGWGLWHSKTEQCSKCGMSSSRTKGCCKDEHQFVKLEKDQKVSEISIQLTQLSAATLPAIFVAAAATIPPFHFEPYPATHAPPFRSSHAVYLLNCIFRI